MRRPPLPAADSVLRQRVQRVLAALFDSFAPEDPREVLRSPLEIDVALCRRVRERLPFGLTPATAAGATFDLLWSEADIEPGCPALWRVLSVLRERAYPDTRDDIDALHAAIRNPNSPNARDFDLFFSFSRANNPLWIGESSPPWVSRLAIDLQASFRQSGQPFARITGSDDRLYHALGMAAYRAALIPDLAASRVGIVILSSDFVRSEACRWELQQMYLAGMPLIVVEFGSLDADTPIPSEIMSAGHSITIPFYRPKHAASAFPEEVLSPESPQIDLSDGYYNRVSDLSRAITLAISGDQPDNGPWVYLAETDDVIQERADMRRSLQKRDLRIAPRRRYPRGNKDEYRAAVMEDLKQCGVFAQILGENPGEFPGGVSPGICYLQHMLALTEKLPMIRSLAEGVTSERSFQQWIDTRHRQLLEDEKDSVELRFFVDTVHETVRKLKDVQAAVATPPVDSTPDAPDRREVFLAYHAADAALADQAAQMLLSLQFTVTRRNEGGSGLPGDGNDGENFIVLQRDVMERCDAVFLIFGPGEESFEWVKRYALQCLKYVNKRRKPLVKEACVLCSFGPPERARPDLPLVENLRYEAFPPVYDRIQFRGLARNVRDAIEDFDPEQAGGEA